MSALCKSLMLRPPRGRAPRWTHRSLCASALEAAGHYRRASSAPPCGYSRDRLLSLASTSLCVAHIHAEQLEPLP